MWICLGFRASGISSRLGCGPCEKVKDLSQDSGRYKPSPSINMQQAERSEGLEFGFGDTDTFDIWCNQVRLLGGGLCEFWRVAG